MDFLTSTILAGLAWDGIKNAGNITSQYLKRKLGEWIIDDQQVETIVDKINEIPDVYKKMRDF